MSVLLATAVGSLYAIAFHQMMGRDIYRVAFGLYLLLNATNLLVVSVVDIPEEARAPFAQLGPGVADPLVQAMVLTAIVISFGIATLVLVLVAKVATKHGSKDTDELRNWRR